jgi:hypothetical protein
MSDDDDQEKLLRALGAVARRQSSSSAEPSSEASAPLDAAARARIADHLADHLERPARASPPVGFARWRSTFGVASAIVALAAGIALVVTHGSSGDPLPAYVLVGSGTSTERGPSEREPRSCVVRASAIGSFEIVARPDESVHGEVVARAYLVRDRQLVVAAFVPEVSSQGAVRLLGATSALVGASEVVFVVGRPGAIPPADTLASHALPASGAGWRAIACAVEPSP